MYQNDREDQERINWRNPSHEEYPQKASDHRRKETIF